MPVPNVSSRDWWTIKAQVPRRCRADEQAIAVESLAANELIDEVIGSIRGCRYSGVRHGGGRSEKLTGVSNLLAFGPDPVERGIGSYAKLGSAGVTDVISVRRSVPQRGGLLARSFKEPPLHQLELETNFPFRKEEITGLLFLMHQKLHRVTNPRVLIHSEDGLVRAPTAIWLYLVALGFPFSAADSIIQTAHPFVKLAPEPLLTRDEHLHDHLTSLGKMMGSFRSGIFKDLFPVRWPA